jgi:hypothetical protein
MLFQLHEWDIHALCSVRDEIRVTKVRFGPEGAADRGLGYLGRG